MRPVVVSTVTGSPASGAVWPVIRAMAGDRGRMVKGSLPGAFKASDQAMDV